MQANEDELQKALNDITNPAPATDDPGTLTPPSDAPEAPVTITPPADAEPAVPAEPVAAAEPTLSGPVNLDAPTPEVPTPVAPTPEVPTLETPATEPAPVTPEPAVADAPIPGANDESLSSVKSNILRDLAPLMDKIQAAPEKKFEIYTGMIEENHDASVIGPAYDTARQIEDEAQRGEALLNLFEKIEEFQK